MLWLQYKSIFQQYQREGLETKTYKVKLRCMSVLHIHSDTELAPDPEKNSNNVKLLKEVSGMVQYLASFVGLSKVMEPLRKPKCKGWRHVT